MKWSCIRNCVTIVTVAIVTVFAINSCESCSRQTTPPVEEIVYISVPDTTIDVNRIIELEHRLKLTKDSLDCISDSLGEDLVIAKIKLARIKEYNRIAGKGNNIKYLRGWINRVLEE